MSDREVNLHISRTIDEQRFRARLAALDAARYTLSRYGEPPTDELLTTYATTLEDWLMRPVELATGGPMPEPIGPCRNPCGAFIEPAWYTGDSWAVCSGEHVTEDEGLPNIIGWHKTGRRGPDLHVSSFATHHMVAWSGPARCACGDPWPCPGAAVGAT